MNKQNYWIIFANLWALTVIDIHAGDTFTQRCADKISAYKNNDRWSSGDNGGWLGIQ